MSDRRPVERVRVTGPRGGRSRPMSAASQIDAQTELGEVFMRTLVRSQLRLAFGLTAALVVTVGLLPLVFNTASWVTRSHLFGIPLPWLVLGVGVYPLLILLAWIYVRRAERNEAAFGDLVNPPDERP